MASARRNMVIALGDTVEVRGVNGTIRFDGQTITILREGPLGRLSVGKGDKHIPMANLKAVQFKPAGRVVNGFIQFTVGGGNEPRSRFGRQTIDPTKDENSVVFHYGQRKEFAGLRDAVQAALARPHQPSTAVGPASTEPAQPAIPEQIEQLAALRDKGALTEAEFEAKKTELLARM
jgi:Domain of unknown function (DUF4429)/Short C-terminal domain